MAPHTRQLWLHARTCLGGDVSDVGGHGAIFRKRSGKRGQRGGFPSVPQSTASATTRSRVAKNRTEHQKRERTPRSDRKSMRLRSSGQGFPEKLGRGRQKARFNSTTLPANGNRTNQSQEGFARSHAVGGTHERLPEETRRRAHRPTLEGRITFPLRSVKHFVRFFSKHEKTRKKSVDGLVFHLT
jgi:hypothetical protein